MLTKTLEKPTMKDEAIQAQTLVGKESKTADCGFGIKGELGLEVIHDGLEGNPREGLCEETLEKYRISYKGDEGKNFPPIEVFKIEGEEKYHIADGYHRYHAALLAKKKSIKVNIHYGTKADLLRMSLSSNNRHGLPRRKEDLKKTILMAIENAELLGFTKKGKEGHKNYHKADIAKLCNASEAYIRLVLDGLFPKEKTKKESKNADCGNEKQNTDSQTNNKENEDSDAESSISEFSIDDMPINSISKNEASEREEDVGPNQLDAQTKRLVWFAKKAIKNLGSLTNNNDKNLKIINLCDSHRYIIGELESEMQMTSDSIKKLSAKKNSPSLNSNNIELVSGTVIKTIRDLGKSLNLTNEEAVEALQQIIENSVLNKIIEENDGGKI